MKPIPLLFVFAYLSFGMFSQPAVAQQALVDSLRLALQNHPQQDSNQAHLYYRLAEELRWINTDEAFEYAGKAIEVSLSINHPASLAKSTFIMGRMYSGKGKPDSARYYFKKAIQVSQENDLIKWEARAYGEWSIVEYTTGNDDEAIRLLQAAIPLAEQSKEKSLLGGLYVNIAGIFFQQGEYKKALQYELRGYRLFLEDPDHRISGIMSNIGQEYGALGQNDSALYYMHKAVEEAYKWNDSAGIAYGYSCLGDQFKETGNGDSAFAYYQKALFYYNAIGHLDPQVGGMYGSMGETLLAKNQFEEALIYLKKSEEILEEAQYLDQLQYTFKSLSETYRALGNTEMAYQYLAKYSTLHDTLTAIAKTNATAELERKFSIAQKEKEIELLNKDNLLQEEEAKQQRLLKNIFIGGAALLLLVAFLLLNRYRLKQQAAAQLEEKNKLIEREKQRAEQSEKFKSQFLANMSHEIRTPLNAISGFTHLLFDVNDENKRLQYLNAIKKSSDNLMVVINDVLDLSKLEAGKMELKKNPFRLTELLHFIYESFQLKAAEKKLEWKIEQSENLTEYVSGDAPRLTQVLMNLAGNAFKFTGRGAVRLQATAEPGGFIRFAVTDSGPGIAASQMRNVFESFVQADAGDRHQSGGTGLGLTISRNLVALMGGTLQVISEEGKGAVFFFSIPLEAANENEWLRHQQRELIYEEDLGEELEGIQVLAAEDNEYNRLLLSDTLKKFIPRVNLSVFNDGKELTDWLQQPESRLAEQATVVLLDVQMPRLDGYETAKFIRGQLPAPAKNLPIIALTASVIRSDLDRCMQAGMNAYVPKPFSAAELLTKMLRVLEKTVPVSSPHSTPILSEEIPAGSTHIRLEVLKKLVGNDEEEIQRHLQLFNEMIPARLTLISEALELEDFDAVRKLVHVMKPQLAGLGLHHIRQLAESIETNFHREEKIRQEAVLVLKYGQQAVEEVRHELGIII
jgi:signal transduction histidine kinase/CheY-like chemotaxis protein/HPt (histidine-containing phosphotransfer) domain-containing protein